LLVPGCPGDCDRTDQLFGDLCHLLHRSDPLHWHSDFTTSVCITSGVFALVPSPVRSGLRRVDKLYAAAVFADSVRCAAYTARTALTSCGVK